MILLCGKSINILEKKLSFPPPPLKEQVRLQYYRGNYFDYYYSYKTQIKNIKVSGEVHVCQFKFRTQSNGKAGGILKSHA